MRKVLFWLGAGIGSLAGGGEVEAEPLFATSNGNAIYQQQTNYLDTRGAEQYSYSIKLTPNGGEVPSGGAIPSYRGSYRGAYLDMAKSAARKHGVPEDLFLRLIQQESGWNPRAKSHKGALGLTQLMPGTARRLGVDPLDPTENLEGGARYLRLMYDRFHSWRLALAAYNAGPEAVERHSGVPPYKETRGYVKAILGG